jgi:hypothetical protein
VDQTWSNLFLQLWRTKKSNADRLRLPLANGKVH